jgi:hypothetical protein
MDPIVGAWRLESVQIIGARLRHPHGPAPVGWLVYTEEGAMVVVLGDGDRPRFGTDDPRSGTTEQRAAALGTCAAYAGRWRREGDEVVHDIELAWFPDWSGSQQRRRVSLDGERLALESPPAVIDGEEGRLRLVWRRR